MGRRTSLVHVELYSIVVMVESWEGIDDQPLLLISLHVFDPCLDLCLTMSCLCSLWNAVHYYCYQGCFSPSSRNYQQDFIISCFLIFLPFLVAKPNPTTDVGTSHRIP